MKNVVKIEGSAPKVTPKNASENYSEKRSEFLMWVFPAQNTPKKSTEKSTAKSTAFFTTTFGGGLDRVFHCQIGSGRLERQG